MEIFDLAGPEFLEFYITVLLVAVIAAVALRTQLRGSAGAPGEVPAVGAYELACLAGGPGGLTAAAVASLVHSEVLKFRRATGRLEVCGPWPADADPLERAVYHTVVAGDTSTLRAVREAITPFTQAVVDRLQGERLLLSPFARRLTRTMPALMIAIVLLAGFIKLGVGLARERPVGYLMLILVIGMAILIALLLRPTWRTRRGDKVLGRLKRENAALQATALSHPATMHPADLVTALALFGPVTLAHGALAPLGDALMEERRRQTLADALSSSSCAVACGGSGCGGGGCGGGGCGGCGGGA